MRHTRSQKNYYQLDCHMSNSTARVITRFPPSPTGLLHVGTLRTGLFNYYFAKQNGGEMKFRVEDTDKERSKKEYEKNIIDSMAWIGIALGEPMRQSERGLIYKKYLKRLIDTGYAYISKETPTEAEERSEVIRFKNPNKVVVFEDLILGPIEVDTTDLGDFVIAKDMDTPLYHLAVVVDDIETGVTHVIRGQDHVSNTPRQILIVEAFGAKRPEYAHLPLILAPDKTKLSKRHGAVSVTQYKDDGYLPEALINFISFVGFNPGGKREIYSLEELTRLFKLENVQKGGGVFDITKLNWMNREYIKTMSDNNFCEKLLEYLPKSFVVSSDYSQEKLNKLLPIIKDRIEKFGDVTDMINNNELDYLFKAPSYDNSMLKTAEFIPELISKLNEVNSDNFTAEQVKHAIWDFSTEKGRGKVLWPMRVALSGREKSPDPFTLAEVLGKEETIKRLNEAITK